MARKSKCNRYREFIISESQKSGDSNNSQQPTANNIRHTFTAPALAFFARSQSLAPHRVPCPCSAPCRPLHKGGAVWSLLQKQSTCSTGIRLLPSPLLFSFKVARSSRSFPSIVFPFHLASAALRLRTKEKTISSFPLMRPRIPRSSLALRPVNSPGTGLHVPLHSRHIIADISAPSFVRSRLTCCAHSVGQQALRKASGCFPLVLVPPVSRALLCGLRKLCQLLPLPAAAAAPSHHSPHQPSP